MANVFVSYQRSDTLLFAHCLAYAIRAAGHDSFVDTGSVPAGTAFATVIDERLARTDLVIVVLGSSFDYEKLRQPNNAVAFEWRRARAYGCAVLPVLYELCSMASAEQLPSELRWLPSLNARMVSDSTLSPDVDAVVNLIPKLAHAPTPSARVLWIDDNPKNNEVERRDLRRKGMSFDNVVSTQEAVEALQNSAYHLVITDLGRWTMSESSLFAGLDALQLVLKAGGPPVLVYADSRAEKLRDEVISRGGFGSTSNRGELYDLIDKALGRVMPPDNNLER